MISDRNNKGIYSCFYESKEFFGCSKKRETCHLEKKTEDSENLFSKALANRFWLTSKSYWWFNKLLLADFLLNGLHEKVNDMLLKVD